MNPGIVKRKTGSMIYEKIDGNDQRRDHRQDYKPSTPVEKPVCLLPERVLCFLLWLRVRYHIAAPLLGSIRQRHYT
jgi:hypothetical protein